MQFTLRSFCVRFFFSLVYSFICLLCTFFSAVDVYIFGLGHALSKIQSIELWRSCSMYFLYAYLYNSIPFYFCSYFPDSPLMYTHGRFGVIFVFEQFFFLIRSSLFFSFCLFWVVFTSFREMKRHCHWFWLLAFGAKSTDTGTEFFSHWARKYW